MLSVLVFIFFDRFFTEAKTLWHVLQLDLVKQRCLSWLLFVC